MPMPAPPVKFAVLHWTSMPTPLPSSKPVASECDASLPSTQSPLTGGPPMTRPFVFPASTPDGLKRRSLRLDLRVVRVVEHDAAVRRVHGRDVVICVPFESLTITPASPFRRNSPPRTVFRCEPWWMTTPASPVSATSLSVELVVARPELEHDAGVRVEERVEDDAADRVVPDRVAVRVLEQDRGAVARERVVLHDQAASVPLTSWTPVSPLFEKTLSRTVLPLRPLSASKSCTPAIAL